MREAARQNQDVGTFQVGVLVPEILGLLMEHGLGGMNGVLVAVAARKNNYPETHVGSLPHVERKARKARREEPLFHSS
jgi:hypothetical protein